MKQLNIFNRPSKISQLFAEIAKECGDPDELRYYQREAYDATVLSLRVNRAVLVVMATGTGKTRVIRTLAKHHPGHVLVLANRDELVSQAAAELEGLDEEVDIEKAEQTSRPTTRLVVGSVQSMNKKRLDRLGRARFTLIIVDEAHHSVAPSYERIFDFFTGAKRVGVTATPNRSDERALGKVYDECAYAFDIESGIEAGYLVPIRGRRIVLSGLELDKMSARGGDLPGEELDNEMLAHVDAIVKETLRLEPDRSAICFFPGRRSAELAANLFNELKPGSAAYVDGFTNKYVRRGIMADFKAGRIRYLCNCGVATEGFDAPNASMVVIARPTLSQALYVQMVGRGGRVLPDVVDHIQGEAFAKERCDAVAASRKPDMMVLDFCGNSQKHSLASVEDVLGGRYTVAEVREAKKQYKAGGNVKEALDAARKHLQDLAKKASPEPVRAQVVSFDPFTMLGLSIDESHRRAGSFGAKPAAPWMIAKLATQGLDHDALYGLSFRAAKKLMDKIEQRAKAGLCSFRQLSVLQKYGVARNDVPKDRASAAIDYIAQKRGWEPHGRAKMGPVDPQVLNGILNYQRASGED
jgi:superfamily II DNA or RNA helicase